MDSDVDVSRWVIELLLRDREKDCIAKRVLAVAPFSDQDYRLKKTVLIRTIECEVYEASVTETILETLEMIEDLDIREGIATTESMKAAYCAVATECTVKFLVGFMGKPIGKYLEAVDRIWRGRVGVLERSGSSQLVSTELRHRMDEVEAGVWDLRVSKKLSRMNTRNDALRLVAVYVKEALALLGPPFITWAIRLNVPKEVADLEADQITVANEANVGGGSEMEGQKKKGANASDGPELEVQMANGDNVGAGVSELENQMANGANVGDGGSELDAQKANEANVGVGRSDLGAETENETTVGGQSDMELQMENGTDVGDGSELEEPTVNATTVGDGDQLEEQTRKEASVSSGSELGPISVAVPLKEVRAGSSLPTVSQSLDSGFTNREVHRSADDQAPGQVNETGLAMPSRNGELDLSIDHTTKDKESQRSTVPRHKHLAHRRTRGPIRIRDAEDSGTEVSTRKYGSLSSSEVNKAQEALKSSISELQEVVTDPLPDALRASETGRSSLAMRSVNHVNGKDVGAENPSIEKGAGPVQSNNDNVRNQPSRHQNGKDVGAENPSIEKGAGPVQSNNDNVGNQPSRLQNGKDIGAENPSIEKGAGPVQSNDDNVGNLPSRHQNDPQSSGIEKDVPNPPVDQGGTESVQTDAANLRNPSLSNQNNVARPSLMERNSTARTFEWEDSIDTSQEGTKKDTGRLHLPSPKRTAVSPLKKYENMRLTKRRKVKRWSLLEEDTLRAGVQKYGKGNWKLILNSYRDIFEERTEVDLKDKWRNMEG